MHKTLIVLGECAPQLEGASFQRRAGWQPCSPAAIIGQYNQTVRHRASVQTMRRFCSSRAVDLLTS